MTTKEYLEKREKYPGPENKYSGWEKDLESIKQFNGELIKNYPWLKPWNRWTGETPDEYDYTYTELDNMPDGWRLAFGDEMVERIHQELVKFNYVNRYRIEQIKEKWGGLRWYDGGTPIGRISEDYREVSTSGTPWFPPYHKENEIFQEVSRDHYISFSDRKSLDMTDEEIERYNMNAVHHYRIYRIEESCKIPDIISEYEHLSFKTCIVCGKSAEWISKGWISPYCTDCAIKMHKEIKEETLETSFTRIEESLIEN